MNLKERLEQYRLEEQRLAWEGTFVDYFEIVKRNPAVADLSHARVYDMIMAAGVETKADGRKSTTSSPTSSSGSRSRSSSWWSTSARRRSGWRCASASCC